MLIRAFTAGLILVSGLMLEPACAQDSSRYPLLIVEQHRASIVQAVVERWTTAAPHAVAARWRDPGAMSDELSTLRADRLLAASLAGDFASIRALLAASHDERPATGKAPLKSLGDTRDDLVFTPVTPCRIVDTRNAVGALQASVTRNYDGYTDTTFGTQGGVASNCGVPPNAAALALSIAAVQPAAAGFIRMWPANAAQPLASLLNYALGDFATATGAIVPVDASNNNRFSVWSPAQVDLVVDVSGYFRLPSNYSSPTTITGSGATVGGGQQNTASADAATVAGGSVNVASGLSATVGGGFGNVASGTVSTIPGGSANRASGFGTFAAGFHANANTNGCFVFSDQSSTNATSCGVTPNQFVVRAVGGVYLLTGGTSDASYTGAALLPGATAWTTYSDRAGKANVVGVDPGAVLRKVAELPIATWNWKSQDEGIRHMGPMAQDFRAAFGLGETPRGISTVDADGVALAAIQGLYAMMQMQTAMNETKDRRIESLERELDAIRQKLGM
jgi:hypothetical protein